MIKFQVNLKHSRAELIKNRDNLLLLQVTRGQQAGNFRKNHEQVVSAEHLKTKNKKKMWGKIYKI